MTVCKLCFISITLYIGDVKRIRVVIQYIIVTFSTYQNKAKLLKDTYINNLPYEEYPSSEQITLARLSSTTELPYPQILLQVPLIQTRTLP